MTICRRHLLTMLAGSAALAGCASPQVQDYAQERPLLELDRYFNGVVHAQGIFQKRGGEVVRRFTVQMDCRWQGNEGVLDETFRYSDGSTQRRVWQMVKHAEGRYSGRADDVVGAAQGQTSGNAFRWNYTLQLPVNGRIYDVQMDDWMFLVDERELLNRARMSKFGVTLGELLVSFRKA